MNLPLDVQHQLLAAAREAAAASYSPYSQFPVGAALYQGGDQPLILGCNVENVSYGLTMCAERTAIFKAVSEQRTGPMLAMGIIAKKAKPCMPCGACLQVLLEFAPEIQLVFENEDGSPRLLTLKQLLPYAFTSQDLPEPTRA
jgi:cytidine deaminase